MRTTRDLDPAGPPSPQLIDTSPQVQAHGLGARHLARHLVGLHCSGAVAGPAQEVRPDRRHLGCVIQAVAVDDVLERSETGLGSVSHADSDDAVHRDHG